MFPQNAQNRRPRRPPTVGKALSDVRCRRHGRHGLRRALPAVRKPCAARFSVSTNGTHFSGDAGRGGQPLPISSAAADRRKTPLGGLEGRSPPNTIRTRRHVRRVRKPCAARFPCAFPRPRPQAQGKRVLAENAGEAGLFRQAKDRRQGFVDGLIPAAKTRPGKLGGVGGQIFRAVRYAVWKAS